MFAGEVDLKTWYKPNIDKKTLKELSKRSDIKGLTDVSIFIVALILSGYLCIISWGTLWSIPALLLYGNIFYCKIISIQHETNHETYFKTRALNKFFYHITSLLGGFEAVRWKWSHFHHHTYTIFTHEEVYDYENNSPKPTEPIRFLLNFLPLGPIINIQKIRHFTHFEIIKHSFGIITPVVNITVPEKEIKKIINSSRLYVGFWLIIILSSIFFKTWLPIIMLILPPFYGNTILMICGMTQHAGLADNVKDHRKSTRTVIMNPFFSFLYSNMEYHIEHHIFPKIPCHNLKAFHNVVKDQMPTPRKGIINAYKEIIPAIFKQAKDKNYYLNVDVPSTN
jgi:fatty acid desaturase|tara:strand:- start:497 stop:1510 length:1014 start_codon:yes stop_codon:yes gene_type:complete